MLPLPPFSRTWPPESTQSPLSLLLGIFSSPLLSSDPSLPSSSPKKSRFSPKKIQNHNEPKERECAVKHQALAGVACLLLNLSTCWCHNWLETWQDLPRNFLWRPLSTFPPILLCPCDCKFFSTLSAAGYLALMKHNKIKCWWLSYPINVVWLLFSFDPLLCVTFLKDQGLPVHLLFRPALWTPGGKQLAVLPVYTSTPTSRYCVVLHGTYHLVLFCTVWYCMVLFVYTSPPSCPASQLLT